MKQSVQITYLFNLKILLFYINKFFRCLLSNTFHSLILFMRSHSPFYWFSSIPPNTIHFWEVISPIFWWIFSLKHISLSLQIDRPICPVMRYRKYLLLYMVTLIGISPFWRNLRFWSWIIFFSLYEFHARLNSHYEARSYKKQKKTKIKSILESWFEKEKKSQFWFFLSQLRVRKYLWQKII